MAVAARSSSLQRGLVVLASIAKHYAAVRAVDDVSLEIRPGELLTLLGPSGSGKSTLLMIIAGFVQPDAGDVLLNGHSILDLPPHKRNIGIVFQQYSLFPHLSVLDNTAYALKVRGVPRAERERAAAEALALVKLAGFEGRRPSQLSGGQQQRVALARALVFKPPILLMDEPLGALDRKLRAEMQLEIRGIQRQLGITTVYVTHDQEEALTISDRIAVIHDGRIAQLGSPVEMYERPASPFVADFLGESNLLPGKVASAANGAVVVRTAGGLDIRAVDDGRFRPGDDVVAALRPERIAVGARAAASARHGGSVEQLIYLGASLRLLVRLGGDRLVASVNRHALDFEPVVGAEVQVGWDLGAPILLHPDSRTAR